MNQLFSRRLLVRLQLWLNSKILRIRRLLLFQKSGNVSVSGDLIVSGNLTISGNTTTLNTETLTVEDNVILLNSSVTDAPSANAGIEIERGSSTNVELRWNETDDKWQFSNDGTTYVNIASTTDVSNHEADTTNVHGIADTSALVTLAGSQTLTNKTLTSPTIIGVSPVITLSGDLTGNVTLTDLGSATLTATVAANSVALGTDTTGNYMSDVTAGTGVTVTHTPGEGSSATIAIGQAVGTSDSPTFAAMTVSGALTVTGLTTIAELADVTADATITSNVLTLDFTSTNTAFVASAPSANFTLNVTNVPTTDNRIMTVTVVVTQGATGYIVNAFQVDGVGQTIKWSGGSAPTATNGAGKLDIFSFSFLRRSGAWTVFGATSLNY
jgi:hypothetical protein